ncbi:MAG: hypothetical protein EXX96DRAFT_558074 [Benjaminiella poitrasii]|nr:MAG: hypothetical protein EXX96DRAFT_558074 [Benjaminiella poitrasii]
MPPKKTNAISNVVNDLMRAAAGASAKDIADEDIDKYVADLILKEAEEKRKKYNEIGVQAYQPQHKKPKPNTRFLLNVVRATDSHNQAAIKANEENVAKLRRERLERESRRTTDERQNRHDRDRERHRRRSSSPRSSRDSHRHERSGRSPSSNERKSSKEEKEIQYKGRGKVRINTSSLDKYFSKGYDPLLDTTVSDDEDKYMLDEYMLARGDDKKKKKSKKKKNKKSKTESDKESSSLEIGPKPLSEA